MDDAAVQANGQVRIPAHLRKKYGIQPGTRVRFIERDNEIVVQPINKELIRAAFGCFKSKTSATEELLKERALDKKREDEKASKIGS